jgi:hypothetical protein
MQELILNKHGWEPQTRRHTAPISDGITDDLIASHDGKREVLQTVAWNQNAEDIALLRRLLRYKVKFSNPPRPARLSGIRASNEWFGTTPPKPTHRRYACKEANLYMLVPQMKPLLERISDDMWAKFKEVFPEQSVEHERLVTEGINKDWWIGNTPFTSGIINDANALPYHRDSGNLKGAWSMMLCLKDGIDGGGLHMPEYDITLAIPDQSLTIFNGQGNWHGVTPWKIKRKDAYRYTLVWYVKDAIKQCGCADDEARRAAAYSTRIADEWEREEGRVS